jgi:hypothetical protein
MPMLREFGKFLIDNKIKQKNLVIPYQDSNYTIGLTNEALLKQCKLNHVRHILQYDNLIKSAYNGFIFDNRFNYFKIIDWA